MNIKINISDEVKAALDENRPVVALESNVITHGLSFPQNLETATEMEKRVRANGAVPATLAVKNGEILVGMTTDQMEYFAKSTEIIKMSSRDLPSVLARKESGVTTVASSLMISNLVGIRFFSSAGLGGVHRNAVQTMDISSDLFELTRSKVAVFCAGTKNILDIALTLEYLETHSVPVISYKTDEFPAFYCRSSGSKSPQRMDNDEALVDTIEAHWALGSKGGIMIARPIDKKDALPEAEIEEWIKLGLIEAEKNRVIGKDVTKFLMKFVERKTEGRSSKANQAVLISNAEFAAQMACLHSRRHSDESVKW